MHFLSLPALAVDLALVRRMFEVQVLCRRNGGVQHFLWLLSSVLGWAGCVLTTATQACERKEGIEEENQNAGIEGEKETVERRHGILMFLLSLPSLLTEKTG